MQYETGKMRRTNNRVQIQGHPKIRHCEKMKITLQDKTGISAGLRGLRRCELLGV